MRAGKHGARSWLLLAAAAAAAAAAAGAALAAAAGCWLLAAGCCCCCWLLLPLHCTSGCARVRLDCNHRRATTATHASTVTRRGQRSITHPICQVSYSYGRPPSNSYRHSRACLYSYAQSPEGQHGRTREHRDPPGSWMLWHVQCWWRPGLLEMDLLATVAAAAAAAADSAAVAAAADSAYAAAASASVASASAAAVAAAAARSFIIDLSYFFQSHTRSFTIDLSYFRQNTHTWRHAP